VLIDLILILPILFGVFTQYLVIKEMNIQIFLIIVIGFSFILLISIVIQILGYNKGSLEIMKHYDIVTTFIEKKNNLLLFIFFPLTMLMEELIFRFYLIGIMINFLNLDATSIGIISSLVFSLSHLQFWFRFKNLRITLVYIITSFIMGIFLAFTLFTIGLFFCFIFHLLIALVLYYNLAKKILKFQIN
jgi:membrane protease YdiL (CAAX protease family)